ncbi:MAG: VWA domain-containing protein [Candidatus Eisenbacteria bacterium]|uniref:VWA domain-containing protein n=1 Tax=Eiseniibacteriota bacterium TaxID=2212470 RepID=A0A956SH17_UNCEI|nr:VWA domain-containing protein [Candidatus Eisenbacteria bacterium]
MSDWLAAALRSSAFRFSTSSSLSTSFVFSTLLFLTVILVSGCGEPTPDRQMRILSGSENKTLEPILQEFARSKGVALEMDYKGSVDIMLALQQPEFEYDAVWPANSLWISIGDTQRRVKHSKSIMTSPVVFGIRKGLAQELGFVGRDVRVGDILAAIEAKRLRFMMTSATQSNSGASAYIGFLYALLGNPDVVTSQDLENPELATHIRALLSGVHRSSGSSGWLKELFLEGTYDAMVNYEAMIIEANQELAKQGREPLYVVYPVDGIVLADSPLGFIKHDDEALEPIFLELQEYLLSDKVQKELVESGRRTGFGGRMPDADPKVWNAAWGIQPNKVLSPIRLPAADVILEALNLYQSEFRKPSLTVFCLDFSGSMEGEGEWQLENAMSVLLDEESSRRFLIQVGRKDKTIIIPFDGAVRDGAIVEGNDPETLLELSARIGAEAPKGRTDIYGAAMRGLEIIENEEFEDYVPAVILMTDGASNTGHNFRDLERKWKSSQLDVPVFCILFGEASEEQLEEIVELTRGRIFDGRQDLIQAFRTAKGYN